MRRAVGFPDRNLGRFCWVVWSWLISHDKSNIGWIPLTSSSLRNPWQKWMSLLHLHQKYFPLRRHRNLKDIQLTIQYGFARKRSQCKISIESQQFQKCKYMTDATMRLCKIGQFREYSRSGQTVGAKCLPHLNVTAFSSQHILEISHITSSKWFVHVRSWWKRYASWTALAIGLVTGAQHLMSQDSHLHQKHIRKFCEYACSKNTGLLGLVVFWVHKNTGLWFKVYYSKSF